MLRASHVKPSVLRSTGLASCHPKLFTQWQFPSNRKPRRQSIPQIAAYKLVLLHRRSNSYSTAVQAQEVQAAAALEFGESSDQALHVKSAAELDPIDTAAKPLVRQVNTTQIFKIKSRRTPAEKLEIFTTDKALYNQLLTEKGSWSYDWREPLRDLEKYSVSEHGKEPSTPKVSSKVHLPRNIHVDKIQRPAIWTKASFHEHVIQLAFSRVDRLIQRQIYSEGETHRDAVSDALQDLFADETLKYVFSVDAGSVGLRFFFDQGRFARGRELFGRLQELQRDTHPSTFNIMLRAAAKRKDLFNFTYILKLMIRYGIRLDSHAWLHLAQAVQEDQVRMIIISKMSERGLLQDRTILPDAVALLIPQMTKKLLDAGEDPEAILEALDNRFGFNWCSVTGAERIVEEVGVRLSTQRALVILQQLRSRGYKPNQGLLLLLLRQCPWSKAHELSIEIIHLFRTEYKIHPSRRIYDVLFKQAWRSRLYNCCRVLWIHACVSGHTSFDMQMMVKNSLCAAPNEPLVDQPRSQYWEETAGMVVASRGARTNGHRFERLMSMWKLRKGKNDTNRDKYLRVVRRILDKDLTICGQFRIAKPLDELLFDALAADRQWALGLAFKNLPLECKYSQVTDVELIPMTSKDPTNQPPAEECPASPSETDDLDDMLPETLSDGPAEEAEQPSQSEIADETQRPATEPRPVHQEESSPTSESYCRMSPTMRLRPCRCPAYVRERQSQVSSSEEEQDYSLMHYEIRYKTYTYSPYVKPQPPQPPTSEEGAQ
ncbi:MAG: hypothetical protein Q9181_006103 [Wetmoreana brouardii]